MSENTKPALIVPALPGDFKVTLSAETIELRDNHLLEAGFITQVTNEDESKEAAKVTGQLKGFAKDVEETRDRIKKPFFRAGQTIDAAAKSASAEIIAEATRIEKLLGAFRQEQLRKAQEERLRLEREAQLEREKIARLQREQEEAERKAAEAERQAAAALERAANLKSKAAREKAEAEAREAKRIADEAAEHAQAVTGASMDAQIAAQQRQEEPKPEPTFSGKVKGASVKPSYVFEVTDTLALYEAWPEAVELVPKMSFIKTMINQPGAKHDIPGLSIREDVKVSVKAVSQADANFLK